MKHKNKYPAQHDFQDDGAKRVKRIVSIIYICIMAFLVGGTYLHQQRQKLQNVNAENSGFSNP